MGASAWGTHTISARLDTDGCPRDSSGLVVVGGPLKRCPEAESSLTLPAQSAALPSYRGPSLL